MKPQKQPRLVTSKIKIECSLFDSFRDKNPRHFTGTLRELFGDSHLVAEEKSKCPLFSSAIYENGDTRSNDNVKLLNSTLIFDCDKISDTQVNEIHERLKGYSYAIYSTWRHHLEDDGITYNKDINRIRVIILLSRQLTVEEYKLTWSAGNCLLNRLVDSSTKDLSRMHALPSCPDFAQKDSFIEYFDGEKLNVDTLINNYKNNKNKSTEVQEATSTNSEKGIARNNTLTSLAGSMRRHGTDEETIKLALIEHNKSFPKPLDEDEVKGIAASVAKYGAFPSLITSNHTDVGNSERLRDYSNEDIKYVPHNKWKSWCIYDGKRWKKDEANFIYQKSKETLRETIAAAEIHLKGRNIDEFRKLKTHILKSENGNRIKKMVEHAQSDPQLIADPSDFDANPYLFNVQNGTIDLRTGALQDHNSKDMITKIAPVIFDINAQCPLFERFVKQIMNDDAENINYLQDMFGYLLLGDGRFEVFFFLYGRGRNGKTTLIEVVRSIVGDDYARAANSDTFLLKPNRGNIREDIARLDGFRFVTAREINPGEKLDMALLKQLVGRDRVAARGLYKGSIEFEAEFKLFFLSNHKPILPTTDEGSKARIRLVEFPVTFSEGEQDENLRDKLKEESSGILNWMVQGAIRVLKNGLHTPNTIKEATEEYVKEMDTFARFIEEICELDSTSKTSKQDLQNSYHKFCNSNGLLAIQSNELNERLRSLGLNDKNVRTTSGPYKGRAAWQGIRISDLRESRKIGCNSEESEASEDISLCFSNPENKNRKLNRNTFTNLTTSPSTSIIDVGVNGGQANKPPLFIDPWFNNVEDVWSELENSLPKIN